MKNIVYLLFVLFALCACKEADTVGTGLYMTGTESRTTAKFAIDALPSSYAISVTSTKIVDVDTDIYIEVDTTLVAAYSEAQGAKFFPLPKGSWELGTKKLTIPAGKSISSATSVAIVDDSEFVEGRTYLIPVTIKQVNGDQEIINSCRTIYLKVSRTIRFNSIDMNNRSMGRNFILKNPIADMPVYTFEFKIFCDKLYDDNPTAYYVVANYSGGDDYNLIRMETTRELVTKMRINIYQAYLLSTTNFEEGRWYHIAVVNDGTTLTLYVDGERDSFTPVTPKNYPLENIQLGTENLGPNSLWMGRLNEMRIWGKVLTPSELKGGMCGVDPASDGLKAYWRLNEGEGKTLYDVSPSQNHLTYPFDIVWKKDENNKCVQ